MKVLVALTYYRPHTSGLTIYVERLARALAARGHAVTVLTSQYEKSLPLLEERDGVTIRRVPVAFRVSKGVIMPTFGMIATRLVKEHDVLSLHLPQFDAAGLALRGRLMKRPVVLTYHCDLNLPAGAMNRLIDRVVFRSNVLSARWSDAIVAYTEDYAKHSPFLSRYPDRLRVIPPPVDLPPSGADEVEAFRRKHNPGGDRLIGMAARLATEKGLEVLLEALPRVRSAFPNARVLFAGQHENVMGEEAYRARLEPLLQRETGHIDFLGILNPREMSAFFPNLDVLVVPSLNSTESFGLVQVEAMLAGTPCVASNLPGVRQPVKMTGMGEIAEIGDPASLGEALVKVLGERPRYVRPREEVAARFSTDVTARKYEELFGELARRAGRTA